MTMLAVLGSSSVCWSLRCSDDVGAALEIHAKADFSAMRAGATVKLCD